jgi:hypothetical protein
MRVISREKIGELGHNEDMPRFKLWERKEMKKQTKVHVYQPSWTSLFGDLSWCPG